MIFQFIAKKKKAIIKIAAVFFIALLTLIYSETPSQNRLEQVLNQGTLRVAVRLGPLTYYEREDIASGLDYNILVAFAEDLGVGIDIEVFDNFSDQLESINTRDDIHLASATLSVTEDRLQRYQFSQSYLEVDSVLIQHTREPRPKDLNAVIETERDILAMEASAHTELLKELKLEHPELSWRENSDIIMFQLMEQVQNQQIDMALIDSSIFDLEGSLFPNVEVALTLKEAEPIAFAFRQGNDNSLVDAMDDFLSRYKASGELDDLLATYLDPEPSIDIAGSLLFNRRIKNRLPTYESLFRSAAEKYDHNWILLAAQAYQESHWNARARSPTGVRGLMMLTLPTAKQLGVESRLDPIESLDGGVRYLLSLKKRLPEEIVEPDRTKFALAAYNVGYGHLRDARKLTERGGDNPNTWQDVQKYLPLLRQRKYFSTVPNGYARGSEPVHYVNNIYRYANILEWYAWQQQMRQETLYVDASSDIPRGNMAGDEIISGDINQESNQAIEDGPQSNSKTPPPAL